MPESPEVDALAGFLRDTLTGAVFGAIDLAEYRALKTRTRSLDELAGCTLQGVQRYGKHLALTTDGADLVISFGRAGWATWRAEGAGDAEVPAPVIATIRFAQRGTLALTDAGEWLSLGLWVVDDPAQVPAIAKLGPDPTTPDWSRADLDRVVTGRRKQLKALLQEQESLSGIGNAYSDEILFVARLDPLMHASDLDDAQRARLYDAIRTVLGDAFAARRGIPPERQKAEKVASMRVHGRTGESCPDGAGVIADVPGSKGAAQYCPECQGGALAR